MKVNFISIGIRTVFINIIFPSEQQIVLQEAFYQVGGVSVMISLLQNMLDMLPMSLPTAEETLGAPEGILPSIAKILFLALFECKFL